ncbi:iripin-2 isoform X2 [Parasteatoda tepidariorum]|uniref:iripin-2 isoform X2 n=1 Tax=Parasteatoda tepidariorum TaxID=114398 RepID=UPI001C721D3D|nr:intracellular coagulation inhibitor 1 isoform X2 [Parasteatoda tepidariorum]
MDSQDSMRGEFGDILALSSAINDLGLRLYQELAKEKRNMFYSPLSLSSALSMLFCGASGSTASEMRQVLGFEIAKIADDKVKVCFQLLMSALEKVPESYTLSNANVVFGQKGFSIKEDFKSLLSESFKAMILEVDFQNESGKAVQQANDWVKEKTNGMIPQLLDSLDPSTVMVLLNAVYFKGFWMHRFNEHSTFQQNFYNKGLEDGAKMVQMMHQKESFPFADCGTYKALQLPYKGKEIAMLILLPNERNGLEDLESSLSSDFIKQLQTKMRTQDVNVTLPKFRLEYSKSMKADFQSLGMNAVFCPGANFDGITDSRNLLVSEIVHKAVIEVNEEGSEAAAATAVVMMLCSLRFDPDFIVDHPFLFFIYNTKTNLILFTGRVDEL